jgi:hypothetical protein
MMVAIDNGCRYSDHCVFFVDLGILAGHRYTLKDVQDLLPALNKNNVTTSKHTIIFTGKEVEFRDPKACCSFSEFVYRSMKLYDFSSEGHEYVDLKDVNVDLSERLKADLKVEHAKNKHRHCQEPSELEFHE